MCQIVHWRFFPAFGGGGGGGDFHSRWYFCHWLPPMSLTCSTNNPPTPASIYLPLHSDHTHTHRSFHIIPIIATVCPPLEHFRICSQKGSPPPIPQGRSPPILGNALSAPSKGLCTPRRLVLFLKTGEGNSHFRKCKCANKWNCKDWSTFVCVHVWPPQRSHLDLGAEKIMPSMRNWGAGGLQPVIIYYSSMLGGQNGQTWYNTFLCPCLLRYYLFFLYLSHL